MTSQDFIVSEIETYLQAHPNAADTLDGIAAWWIAWPGDPDPSAVLQAIEVLEQRGILERVIVGNKVVFRARRRAE